MPNIGVTKFVGMETGPGRLPPDTLRFEGIPPNATLHKHVTVRNETPLPLNFHWNTYKAPLRVDEEARPASFAPRSLRRALLMPQVNPGSLHRGGRRT